MTISKPEKCHFCHREIKPGSIGLRGQEVQLEEDKFEMVCEDCLTEEDMYEDEVL